MRHDELAAWTCDRCHHQGAIATLPAVEPHFATIHCGGCGRWIGWMEKPKSAAEQKTRRRTLRVKRLADDRCWACLKTRDQLAAGITLEPHHIIDRAVLIDRGLPSDLLENLCWICSVPCHPIINGLRAAADHLEVVETGELADE